MQQNVQKYSKTIRPNLDANESVYTGVGIGRTSSIEDMTNTASNSGKFRSASPVRRYNLPPQGTGYNNIPSPPSMYDSRGPVINDVPNIKKPRGSITIMHQPGSGDSPITETPPPPPPSSTVIQQLPDSLAIEQMMQLIPFETPKDIMANGEHKDAGHEESSISSAGMGGDSI